MTTNRRKPAAQCDCIEDVREAIDALDRDVMDLWHERLGYIEAASKLKPTLADVRVPSRIESMMQQRRVWAQERNLSPDAIEKLFRELVEYFISEEECFWKNAHENRGS